MTIFSRMARYETKTKTTQTKPHELPNNPSQSILEQRREVAETSSIKATPGTAPYAGLHEH